ncbi:MAG TPA: ATP-binding protein [Burkholderiales bacterium]
MTINQSVVLGESVPVARRSLRALDITPVSPRPAKPQPAKRRRGAAAGSLRAAMRALLGSAGATPSERQLRMLLVRLGEAMLEGLAVYGPSGEIAYVNDNLCHMLGRSRDELIGRPAYEYFGQVYERARRRARAGASGSGRERYETELTTKAGRIIVVEACSERIKDAAGRYLGAFAVMSDITARVNVLRQYESEVRLLSAQFVAAQELERRRIALELHDGIGQALGGVKFGLETCEALITAGSCSAAAQRMVELVTRIQSVLDEVRRISMNLRPSTLDDLGILPTLGWFAREFRAIHQQPELDTLVDVAEDEIAVPVKTAIYRIVQEACNNVVTHSTARKVCVSLRRQRSHIELQVHDDGSGFDPAVFSTADESGRGLGLASMRERAEVTGGRFALRSQPGSGTTVRVLWPARRMHAAA